MTKHSDMEAKKYTVSKTTQNFIDCLLTMQNLYGQVGSAIEYMYGENQKAVDDIINERVWEKYDALWDAMKELMADSITEQLGNVNSTEI